MTFISDRQQIIKKLLTTLHLNALDRKIFKDNPITLSEISNSIRHDLEDVNIFPRSAKESQGIYEGYHIEKVSNSQFKLHWQRPLASNPFQLAETNQVTYSNFDKLIYDYLDKEFTFNIDGLIIDK